MSCSATAAPWRCDGVGRWRRLAARAVGKKARTAFWLDFGDTAEVVDKLLPWHGAGRHSTLVGTRRGKGTNGTVGDLRSLLRARSFGRLSGDLALAGTNGFASGRTSVEREAAALI
jgi:hypothetical protein